MIINAADLTTLVAKILVDAGASQSNANCVAAHLVSANLCGVDTHGVWHVAGYVSAIKNGDIVPDAVPEMIIESPVSALVTGHWTFGQVAAKYAMEKALDKASEHGLAVASLVQCHHIGRLGEYAEMAAARGMISMIWAGGFSEEAPAAAPYGGKARVLHTNPVAMGFPAGREVRMMFDFATTVGSGVKINNANRKGEPVPLGWIVDKDGNPTTQASDFFAGGAHLPFGGHKGYAFMMAAEFLGRIFAGSDSYAEAGRGGAIMRHQGVTMIVVKANLFQTYENYTARADEMLERVRNISPAPGFAEVLVPGDLKRRTRATREREGIPIPDDLWQQLTALAGSAGAV